MVKLSLNGSRLASFSALSEVSAVVLVSVALYDAFGRVEAGPCKASVFGVSIGVSAREIEFDFS